MLYVSLKHITKDLISPFYIIQIPEMPVIKVPDSNYYTRKELKELFALVEQYPDYEILVQVVMRYKDVVTKESFGLNRQQARFFLHDIKIRHDSKEVNILSSQAEHYFKDKVKNG